MKMASLGSLPQSLPLLPPLPVNRFRFPSAPAACSFMFSDSCLRSCKRGSGKANRQEMLVGGASVFNGKKPWRSRGVKATGVSGAEGGGGGSEDDDDAQDGVIQARITQLDSSVRDDITSTEQETALYRQLGFKEIAVPTMPALHQETSQAYGLQKEEEEELLETNVNAVNGELDVATHAEDVKAPPLAGENAMNVILVAAECAPWSKTGGLGDVAGALPKFLARRGHRVMVVVPRYGEYQEGQHLGVYKQYKVDGQDHEDVLKRMILFCKAAVEVPWCVPCGGVIYGDGNLVFIANDWHAALLPVYLKAYYRDKGSMTYTRSVLVIHNIAHQSLVA
ncbi:hypothetical protein ACLOJK_029118 [Asimina triloba]